MSINHPVRLSRRKFLKKVCVGVATTATLLTTKPYCSYASGGETTGESEESTWGMLIDVTRCVGCNSCALACKTANQLPDADDAPEALDSNTYTFVDEYPLFTDQHHTKTRFVKRQCMHCLNASCVSACPAAAMHNSGVGPVVYEPTRCLGCRYCQLACPFGIPSFEWSNGLNPVISKCWLCIERINAGQIPACAEACTTGALRFGRRDKLLAQAHAQIASNPKRYLDHVFGESEVGGTSMLYLSDTPFETLGFPKDLPETAPPEETEKIMVKLPYVIAGVGALMTGVAAYTHRKPVELAHETEADDETSPLISLNEQEV